MKIRYFVIEGKNEYVSIYMRFWDGKRIDQKARTGLTVLFDNWSDLKQQVKPKANESQRDFINSNLRELKNHVIESYNIDYNSGQYIGNDWLKGKINGFFNRATDTELHKIYFVEWVKHFIRYAPTRLYKGKNITAGTIKNYQTALGKLEGYEKHTKSKLRFADIDLSFYREFVNYCREIETLNQNTIGVNIKRIKFFCRQIELEGLTINQQFKHSEFMALSNKTKDVYLNEVEISKIFDHDFSQSVKLDNVRDLLIVGLRTGLRISDFLRLKDINLKKGFIEIETQKTGEPVIIPLHSQIQSILDKRSGILPRSISDQKFNEYVKEVCEAVGITDIVSGAKMNPKTKRKETGLFPKYELISSHTCRRSFASNLYGKLTNMVIMAITGHRSEAQFLKYIKITKQEHAETLNQYWAKEQKEQGYTNVLTVIK